MTFQIPAVLSLRLDQLVAALERQGPDPRGAVVTQRTTSRKELVAALIHTAETEPQRLESLLVSYRDAQAGTAVIPPRTRGTIEVPPRSPGMRLTSEQQRLRNRGRRPARRNRYSTLEGNALS